MSCLSMKKDLASIIQYKISKINKWKIFRQKKRYARNTHRYRNFALVYADKLYTRPNPVPVAAACKHVEMLKEVKRSESEEGIMGKIERSDNPVLVGISSDQSNTDIKEAADDVDLRAEIFIRKFKEEMRKQR